MKILFLHPNFPAQFKQPCTELAGQHEVVFICETHYGRKINNVRKIIIKTREGSDSSPLKLEELTKMQRRSDSYRYAFTQLANQGWNPDVVVSHCGWGCGFHTKEIWPKAKFVAYVEWWFSQESDLTKSLAKNPLFEYSSSSNEKMWKRNGIMAMELATADLLVTPSYWQQKQLPEQIRRQCRVCYDKVDETLFRFDRSKISKIPKLTYGTRGMEPMRGFPEFISCLPPILDKWPSLIVEIAGEDENNYGGKMPKEGTWGKWAHKQLSVKYSDRVIFKGRMMLREYANWLKSSWCHVYLTEPFVTSWSLNEALHCNTPIVATNHECVKEFTKNKSNVILANHKKQDELVSAINQQLRNFSPLENIKHQALTQKNHISPEGFSLSEILTEVSGAEATTNH